ncbi:hypothetical protein Sme01_36410 [Sphaerisporangium melleum]|uniref:Uncharacterized protein n=1 Tax=Sphaerisporangium melleum TaxID=321316 RepID=A0A917RP55_9ACTN|nr:hypothetical protein [Sphaerisporangium melleum]GGL16406.1 hypothetical protein GCM10007964_67960 [Sphaerisporangium melleum]GII71165.1 hypothetical protein Sme01_36410 [Sphaerisporangium melleum]
MLVEVVSFFAGVLDPESDDPLVEVDEPLEPVEVLVVVEVVEEPEERLSVR